MNCIMKINAIKPTDKIWLEHVVMSHDKHEQFKVK